MGKGLVNLVVHNRCFSSERGTTPIYYTLKSSPLCSDHIGSDTWPEHMAARLRADLELLLQQDRKVISKMNDFAPQTTQILHPDLKVGFRNGG